MENNINKIKSIMQRNVMLKRENNGYLGAIVFAIPYIHDYLYSSSSRTTSSSFSFMWNVEMKQTLIFSLFLRVNF